MTIDVLRIVALPLSLSLVLSATPASALADAKSAVPGAMANDRTMTCQDIAAERGTITTAIADTATKQEQARKTKKRLFGFAKGLASIALPGAALLGGGASAFGNLAAQQAGNAALNALGDGTPAVAPKPAEARPSEAQQARLTRLDSIAAYRQCAA